MAVGYIKFLSSIIYEALSAKGVLFVFKYIKIPRLKVCPQMVMLIIKAKKSVKEGYYISPLIVWFAGSDIIIRLLFKN